MLDDKVLHFRSTRPTKTNRRHFEATIVKIYFYKTNMEGELNEMNPQYMNAGRLPRYVSIF